MMEKPILHQEIKQSSMKSALVKSIAISISITLKLK